MTYWASIFSLLFNNMMLACRSLSVVGGNWPQLQVSIPGNPCYCSHENCCSTFTFFRVIFYIKLLKYCSYLGVCSYGGDGICTTPTFAEEEFWLPHTDLSLHRGDLHLQGGWKRKTQRAGLRTVQVHICLNRAGPRAVVPKGRTTMTGWHRGKAQWGKARHTLMHQQLDWTSAADQPEMSRFPPFTCPYDAAFMPLIGFCWQTSILLFAASF